MICAMATSNVDPGKISAQRLRFRKLLLDDAAVWEEFLTDPEAVKLFPPFGEVKGYAIQWIEKQVIRYERDGSGLFALIEKNSNQFVGQCGLMIQEVSGVNEVEIGYHLLPRFWKNGFASEAAIACKNFAFENNLFDSLISIIDVRNAASMKVAERNGMRREKQMIWRDLNVFIYRINKKDWRK